MDEKRRHKITFLNSPILESANHKVVIVFDRSPKYAASIPAADIPFTIRDDQNNPISGKLSKILWNCSTEAIMEFHRVVLDLFPQGQKQLRFVTSDFVGKFLTEPWSDKLITHEQLLKAMINCEPPQVAGDASSCSILNGILFALEAISERTPLQRKALRRYHALVDKIQEGNGPRNRRINVADLVCDSNEGQASDSTDSIDRPASSQRPGSSCSHEEGEIREMDTKEATTQQKIKSEENQAIPEKKNPKAKPSKFTSHFPIKNRGAIVVITSIDSMSEYDAINEYVDEQIEARNNASRNSVDKRMVRIDHLDLYVLNIALNADLPSATFKAKKRHQLFNSRLISVAAESTVIAGIHKILQEVYELVSTTVVGIPMKEETQSGQSVNYDVEMLHPRAVHSTIHACGLLSRDKTKILDNPSAHGNLFQSVRLKWCTVTAKLRSEMFPLLQDSFPITPAHVNNRASVCLTSFILSGKNVMLEVFPEAYQDVNLEPPLGPNLKEKLISHYLSRDINGHLIIHCVGIGEKATLGGMLNSEGVYGEKCSSDLATDLNCRGMATLAQTCQIQPIPLEKFPSMLEIDTTKKQNDRIDEIMSEMANEIPFYQRDTLIFNVTEKFEPLLSTITKAELSAELFEQCRLQIHTLVSASRTGQEPLTDKIFRCSLFASGTTVASTKEEQYKVAFDELGRLLQRYACNSPAHGRLYILFCDQTGIRPEPVFGTRAIQSRKRPFAESTSNSNAKKLAKLDEEAEMQKRIEYRRAQVATLWKPGEEVNLFDWWKARYEKEFWSNWKGEFAGRLKYGDNAQDFLYPNLKLPPGQSKGAGTGTAGPIE